MSKQIIILNKPKGARLANQLWNFASVYAYCLEKGYKCKNYSFFEDKKQENKPNSIKTYYQFFNMRGTFLIRFLLWLHVKISRISIKPRLYYRYVDFIKRHYPKNIIYSGDDRAYLLPPSTDEEFTWSGKTLYLDGWLFRNPIGLEKHRAKIRDYFRPNKNIREDVENLIAPLRESYEKVIGVHIRQGDYKKLFEGGRYYFNEKEVRAILDEYLEFAGFEKERVIFLLCSDESIDTSPFEGLNIKISKGNEAQDLFALSRCDVILGSQSTYGPFAALYGNMPFIMFERKMDWDYYKSKDISRYFDNEKVGLLN